MVQSQHSLPIDYSAKYGVNFHHQLAAISGHCGRADSIGSFKPQTERETPLPINLQSAYRSLQPPLCGITISVGLSYFPEHGATIDEIPMTLSTRQERVVETGL